MQSTIATGVDDTAVGRGNYAAFSASTLPLSVITYTTPEGVFVTDDTNAATWANGSRALTVSSTTPVYVYETNAGVHEVTVTSGGKTIVAKVKASRMAANAYNIQITPAAQNLATGGLGTTTVTLTDVFGNEVPGSSANTVRVTAAGDVLLGGFQAGQDVAVGAISTDSDGSCMGGQIHASHGCTGSGALRRCCGHRWRPA